MSVVLGIVAKGNVVTSTIDDTDSKTRGSPRDCASDPPIADNPQRLSGQAGSEEQIEVPTTEFAGAQKCVSFDNPPGDGKNQSPGQIRRGISQNIGSVGDINPTLLRRGQIDIVITHRDIGDDLQSGSGGNYFPVNLIRK